MVLMDVSRYDWLKVVIDYSGIGGVRVRLKSNAESLKLIDNTIYSSDVVAN